ncbi:uncharacterized protein PHACADRAFT_202871 [Phanerochaete carnosa HHB-10118-sp]|uniref:Uncharacterized protein n=1 Tax=Phanerochaete carnosa (strain HHB-10118-sp) TaxID=650164 RepID=K5VNW4_PHACS|nr:uncharacterized protein PHACADRAFT_202871 [Phanerochaete carnosa HHB-10118-sp]EKM48390.1 hypothetical protein PHACADRAFT_202871 [Phanerochaete carnosa HHB-10118-sp]
MTPYRSSQCISSALSGSSATSGKTLFYGSASQEETFTLPLLHHAHDHVLKSSLFGSQIIPTASVTTVASTSA